MGTVDATGEQHHIWNELVGDAWARHDAVHDEHAAPFGEAALRAIGPVAGASVLDVGCGTGTTAAALAAAGAVEVVGVDLSEPMIAVARAGNDRANVRFEVGDVLGLEPRPTFDAVFSRFAVMFFADPVAAFSHLRALGRPGVRLGFCCWGPPADNPWMAVPVMATIPVLGPPTLAGPGEPGPFSLSDPEVVTDVLDRAGWTDVRVEPLTLDRPHPAGDATSVASVVAALSPPIAEGLHRNPDRAEEVLDAIAAALRPLERDGAVHLGASAQIVTARA